MLSKLMDCSVVFQSINDSRQRRVHNYETFCKTIFPIKNVIIFRETDLKKNFIIKDFPFTIMELQVAEQKHQHFRKCTLSKESKSTSGAISSDSLSFSGLVLPEKNVVSIILKFQFHTNELFISLEETYSNLIYLKGFRQNSILVISVICSMIPSAFKLIKILIESAFIHIFI